MVQFPVSITQTCSLIWTIFSKNCFKIEIQQMEAYRYSVPGKFLLDKIPHLEKESPFKHLPLFKMQDTTDSEDSLVLKAVLDLGINKLNFAASQSTVPHKISAYQFIDFANIFVIAYINKGDANCQHFVYILMCQNCLKYI
uniref:Uncharacterized protein n=1 Tax=Micrurus carvalhoi TaxID=3147026 RepID=A0A2H6MWW7_9SAUR